jgi:hypothetical protein
MRRREFNPFTCPSCGAFYQVVRIEVKPKTADRQISCEVCNKPLTGREGNFVLMYFFLRKGIRRQRHRTTKLS